MTTKIKYALWLRNSREGDFEFLCSNQQYVSANLEEVRQALKDAIEEHQDSYEPRLSKKEALDDLGKPIIFKLTMEEVK